MTTITVRGPGIDARVIQETGDFGNLRGLPETIELAALAQNGVAGIGFVPPYCTLIGCHWFHDALGANTTLSLGTESQDGTGAAAAAIKADAASTAAGAGYAAFEPIDSGANGLVITGTQGGTGTATGTVGVTPVYIHRGY